MSVVLTGVLEGGPFDEPLFWIGVVIGLVFLCVLHILTKRCPKCGRFALREKGNRISNFFHRVFPPRAKTYEVICKKCGFEETREYTDPID